MHFQKNKRIRWIAAALAACLLLAGCGQRSPLDKNDPVVLTIWHYYNGNLKDQFDELVKEFNETQGAQQGIVVQAYSQGSVNELAEKVLDSLDEKVGSDRAPDLFASYADTAYEANKRGLVADMGSYFTKEEKEAYFAPYLNEGKFSQNDDIKLFPVAKSTEVLMLNATDWAEFSADTGITTQDLATWEGVVQAAERYYRWTDDKTPAPNDGKAFFGRDSMANYLLVGSAQLGQELFSVENGQASVSVDKEVMRRLWDNYYVPYINGYFVADGRFRTDDAKTGDLIALVGSTSGASYFPSEVVREDGSSYPIESIVLPLPNFEGTAPMAVQQGAGLVVLRSDEKKEYAAAQFLKWFTAQEQNVSFSIGSGYLPVTIAANDPAVLKEAADKLEGGVSEVMEKTLETGASMTTTYQLYTPAAFENGTAARAIVNDSMQQKAQADRDEILELMAKGVSRQQAVAQFDTDENFAAWYDEFCKALEATVKMTP